MPNPAKGITAAQEVLFGAFDLAKSGKVEFSEWDLTVATWKRNPNRFGCRGYEAQYPDHKRVMMEIMGSTKDNPLRRGWIEKTKPNTYTMTNVGQSEAERLAQAGDVNQQSIRSPQAIFDAVLPLYKSTVFLKHTKDREEPRMWLGAASFFQLKSADALHMEDRIKSTEKAIENAIEWVEESGSDLKRGVTGGSEAISKHSLLQLRAFYQELLVRFEDQIAAIKRSKK